MNETPKPQTIWYHNNGCCYEVIAIANEGDRPNYPETVVYRNLNNGKWYTRPASDWHRSMTEKV